MHRFFRFGLLALLSLVVPQLQAVPVTIDFTAIVDSTGGSATPQGLVGEIISASLTYESATADLLPGNPAQGEYEGALTAASVSVGGFAGVLAPSPLNLIRIQNDLTQTDGWGFAGSLAPTATVNGLGLTLFTLEIITQNLNLVTSEALPTSGAGYPPLGGEFLHRVTLYFDGGHAFATTISYSVTPVASEGGAVGAMVAAAVAALIAGRQRA